MVVVGAGGGCGGSAGALGHPVTDVVFDFCGVLVDWQPARVLEKTFDAKLVRDFTSMGDRCGFLYYDDVLDGGADFEETAARYEAERGPELAAMFRAYYEHIEGSLVRLMPGMPELVRDLRALGVGCWGLTNWSRACAGAFSHRFPELDELLDGVIVSGVEGVKKPDAEVFRLAERRWGLTPASTVFVDDNSLNADAARELGWGAVSFIDAGRTRRALVGMGLAGLAADAPAQGAEVRR